MKKAVVIIVCLGICACQKKEKYDPIIEARAHKMVDSIEQNIKEKISYDEKSSYLDKKLTQNSPVQVTSARFVKKEYSTYKDVELKWKNVSDKTVSAVRFEWYGENSFGEPADMGIVDGEGGGFSDNPIKPGKTDSGTWGILSRDGKKIIGARAYEVVFEDGTKWNLHN